MPATYEEHIRLHEEWAASSLRIAKDWNSKGERGFELSGLHRVLRDLVTIAVSKFDSQESGIRFLSDVDATNVLNRTLELLKELFVDADGPRQTFPPPGVFDLILVVHLLWTRHRLSEADEVCSLLDPDRALRFYQKDKFWKVYSAALVCAGKRMPYTPAPMKLVGYQKFLLPYVHLLGDITSSRDTSESLASVDSAFSKRNRDKRLMDGNYDGDGTFPVKWDFRKQAILAFRNLAFAS